MFRLDGKRALITGASGGIGAAIARALHAQGAEVILSGTRRPALEALAAELGGRARVIPADLSEAAASDALIAEATEGGAALDILVNNAGLTRDALALRLKDEDWEKVLAVDLTAPFRLSRAALKTMIRRRWGRIINIASIVGVTGNPGQANYAAAKAGLIGMTKSLAQEVAARGITVNAIAPGYIDTDMVHAVPEDVLQKIIARIPVGRLGKPEEIAEAVVFLASEKASFITGATLTINGGQYMI